jgi:hypothetical protein
MKEHVIISGTGRAGTTFLVALLTRLGLDTGFDRDTLEVLPHARKARKGTMDIVPVARSGLEMNIRAVNAPYIVKTPFLCDTAESALSSSIRIKHAIIPVRQFDAAAASRAHVQEQTTGSKDRTRTVPGGLWDADKAAEQADVLRLKFARLVETLTRYDVPMTFLSYPRLVGDADYLYGKLDFLLAGIDRESFRSAFDEIVRPEWVHQFTAADP